MDAKLAMLKRSYTEKAEELEEYHGRIEAFYQQELDQKNSEYKELGARVRDINNIMGDYFHAHQAW